MAIPFQSNLNNMVATGIQNAKGTVEDIGSLSGGTMPEAVRRDIAAYITDAMVDLDSKTDFQIPTEIYSTVANMMLPYTPSLSIDTLTTVLKTNSVFGNIDVGQYDVTSIINNKLNEFTGVYESKLLEVTGGFEATLNKLGISDHLGAITEQLTSSIRTTINDSFRFILDPVEMVRFSPDVLYTFLKGDGFVELDRDLPDLKSLLDNSSNETLQSALTENANSNVVPPPVGFDLTTMSDEQKVSLSAAYVKTATGTDLSIAELEQNTFKLNATLAGTLDETPIDQLPGPPPFPISDQPFNPASSSISSIEELYLKFAEITRPVSEVIVHWTETYTNAFITKESGYEVGGYHLLVLRDGSVQEVTPLNSGGSHCPTLNHNAYSIGVCFVGGLNVASGSEDLYEVASARSITQSQYRSFYHIMEVFFVNYAGGQVLGHMDIDVSHSDPGFDVRDYAFNNFGKQSMYTDPYSESALSPEALLSILPGNGIGSTPPGLNKNSDVVEKNF